MTLPKRGLTSGKWRPIWPGKRFFWGLWRRIRQDVDGYPRKCGITHYYKYMRREHLVSAALLSAPGLATASGTFAVAIPDLSTTTATTLAVLVPATFLIGLTPVLAAIASASRAAIFADDPSDGPRQASVPDLRTTATSESCSRATPAIPLT